MSLETDLLASVVIVVCQSLAYGALPHSSRTITSLSDHSLIFRHFFRPDTYLNSLSYVCQLVLLSWLALVH